jgi:hypothetical protein
VEPTPTPDRGDETKKEPAEADVEAGYAPDHRGIKAEVTDENARNGETAAVTGEEVRLPEEGAERGLGDDEKGRPPGHGKGRGRTFTAAGVVLACLLIAGLVLALKGRTVTGGGPAAEHHQRGDEGAEPAGWFTTAMSIAIGIFLFGVVILLSSHLYRRYAHGLPGTNEQEIWAKRLHEVGVDVVRDVGIALMIGGLVTGTFESSLRRHEEAEHDRRVSAIQKDAVKYLLGYGIDPAVMEEVYNNVFKAKLVREEMGVTFQFSQYAPADPNRKLVRLRTSVTYRVRNMANEDLDYPMMQSFGDYPFDRAHQNRFTDLVVTYPPDLAGKGVRLDRAAFDAGKYEKDAVEDDGRRVEVEVARLRGDGKKGSVVVHTRFPDGFRQSLRADRPFVIPAGREIEVSYATERVKRDIDSVTLLTMQPVKHFHVKAILCDPAVVHLHLVGDASHRRGPAKVSLADPDNRCTEWRFPTAVLPGQGFELTWYPKPPTGEPAGAPPPKDGGR